MKVHNAHPYYIHVCVVKPGNIEITENIWLSNITKLNWIERDAYKTLSLNSMPSFVGFGLDYNNYQSTYKYTIE